MLFVYYYIVSYVAYEPSLIECCIIEELKQWSEENVSKCCTNDCCGIFHDYLGDELSVDSRKMFEVFCYTHRFYTLYIIFYLIHVKVVYVRFIFPGIFLWVIDWYLRFLQLQRRVNLVSAHHLPCGVVEQNFLRTPGLIFSPRADHWNSFLFSVFCQIFDWDLPFFSFFLIRTKLQSYKCDVHKCAKRFQITMASLYSHF